MSEALRRSANSASAVMAPTAAPCHTNCSNAQATACAAGWRNSVSIAGIVITATLLVVPRVVNGVANAFQLFRRGALGRKRLHYELAGRAAEGAIEQVAHELALRGFLAEPRAIDVRAVALVALDEPLLRHDLEQLQGGGIGGLAIVGQLLVHLAHGAGPTFPENSQDGQLGVGGARSVRSGHGRQYLREPS